MEDTSERIVGIQQHKFDYGPRAVVEHIQLNGFQVYFSQ